MTALETSAVGLPVAQDPGGSPAIIASYIEASRAKSTLKAYDADWRHFMRWCADSGHQSLPAEPNTVAAYLAYLAAFTKVATIQRRSASINAVHKAAGVTSPTTDEGVRLVVQGIRRSNGAAQHQVKPILLDELKSMLDHLPDNLRGIRDRALLLIGWAGAFRRSELAAINVEDLEFTDQGLVVTIRKSKTDQESVGRQVGIPLGQNGHCPLARLTEWLEASGIDSGPVFRKVDRHGHVGPKALDPSSVAQVIKTAAHAAGLDPTAYSGHSLRAGLATSAAMGGATPELIMAQTGHKSAAMVARYIRRGTMFKQNAASVAGL